MSKRVDSKTNQNITTKEIAEMTLLTLMDSALECVTAA